MYLASVPETMQTTPPRATRIAHWLGLAFALPLVAMGLYALTEYWRGSFPATVTGADAALLFGFILVCAAILYATPHIIGWTISFVVARKIKG
jgi:hypothetical protein